MSRSLRALAGCCLPALLILLAASSASGQTPTPIAWQSCGALQCGTVSVPVDYANPAGARISIAVIRQPARVPSQRAGAIVFNPGGPGGSGLTFLRDWITFLPAELQNRFDLVSFDPRGIGESAPLSCADNVQQLIALDASPEAEQERDANVEAVRALAQRCQQRAGDLFMRLGTREVAQDLDEIRRALGEEKLNYFGFSYGTVLGQVYAQRFPGNVRAMVLDGPFDLSLTPADAALQQSKAFESALLQFLDDCRRRACISSPGTDLIATVERVIATSEATPIPARTADRAAGPGEVLAGIFQGLYSESLWPELGRALQSASNGDGSGLVSLADDYYGRLATGRYNNSFEMYAAVSCLDQAWPRDPAYFAAEAGRAAAEAPHFGTWNLQTWLPCAVWPAGATLASAPVSGVPPLLVVGTTGDPATPYTWAEAVNRQIPGSVLLRNNDEGHIAYLDGGACLQTAVHRYLISLELPAAGTSCGDASLAQPFQVALTPTAVPTATATPVATATSTPAVSATSEPTQSADDESSTSLVLIGAIALVILIAVGALVLVLRGRRG